MDKSRLPRGSCAVSQHEVPVDTRQKGEWITYLLAVWHARGLTMAEKAVAMTLAMHRNGESGQCNPSIATISDRACIKRTAAKTAIKGLREKGLINVLRKETPTGDQTANQYDLILKEWVALSESTKQRGSANDLPRSANDLPRSANDLPPVVKRPLSNNLSIKEVIREQKNMTGFSNFQNQENKNPAQQELEVAVIDASAITGEPRNKAPSQKEKMTAAIEHGLSGELISMLASAFASMPESPVGLKGVSWRDFVAGAAELNVDGKEWSLLDNPGAIRADKKPLFDVWHQQQGKYLTDNPLKR